MNGQQVEDWSPRRFYLTMRRVFNPSRGYSDFSEIPFYIHRPLSHNELKACTDLYIANRQKHYLGRIYNSASTTGGPPSEDQWPDLNPFGFSNDDFWKAEIVLGRLYFAKSVPEQQEARKNARQLAQRGPMAFRRAIGKAIRCTPQAKRRFSPREMLTLIACRSEFQFIWSFLRRESGLTREEFKKPARVSYAATELAKAYPYLHLRAEDIAKGLVNPHQADRDTAEEYGLSEQTIRSLLSRTIPKSNPRGSATTLKSDCP